MGMLRRWVVATNMLLGPCSLIGCVGGLDSPGSSPGLDDPDDHDVGDPEAGPGISFTVPDGMLEGRYVFGDDVLCEIDAGSGYAVVVARDDSEEHAPADVGSAFFIFAEEPGDWDYLTEGWDMYWRYLQYEVEVEPGPLCYVQVIDGWPEMTAVFECNTGVLDFGGTQPVEMVDGTIECP